MRRDGCVIPKACTMVDPFLVRTTEGRRVRSTLDHLASYRTSRTGGNKTIAGSARRSRTALAHMHARGIRGRACRSLDFGPKSRVLKVGTGANRTNHKHRTPVAALGRSWSRESGFPTCLAPMGV